ncbi:uncharacterized protein BP5553_07925 [Venustampulla echinocandica]|uniref:DUF5672 domain-containing protein n=1 Tax=Venustampulla echinocandica TaxID=2656787 RepID=A0A370THX0_9HELO|nr:uncharacterized protein BP5553_07925 [Venustampulla echinocandica]RDL34797.1 hypothetical protein BP5553_07925 [Venustampulla echinocandica]
MFTDISLYRDILAPAENLLVFQPDSIFCAAAPLTINDYLGWDWIGAPWSPDAQHGGNGGLSLRKVSKMLQVLKAEDRKDGDGELEDLWLTNRMVRLSGANMPNATVSKTFSVESVWDEKPLGYHVGWLGVHHPQYIKSSGASLSTPRPAAVAAADDDGVYRPGIRGTGTVYRRSDKVNDNENDDDRDLLIIEELLLTKLKEYIFTTED